MAGQSVRDPKGGMIGEVPESFGKGIGTDPKSKEIPDDWAGFLVGQEHPNVTVIYQHTSIIESPAKQATRIVPIHSLASEAIALKNPVSVEIFEEDGEFIAKFEQLDLYGSGKTESLALNMLTDEIVTLYEELKPEERLGPLPKKWLAVLEDIVEEK